MQIRLDKKFEINFNLILEYIAKDKSSAAKQFKEELYNKIENLKSFPRMYRKSIYFDDENIRDMTFKTYTINYEINLNKNTIFILSIFNQNKPLQ